MKDSNEAHHDEANQAEPLLPDLQPSPLPVSEDMAQLVFMPSGKRGLFPHGTPILSAARRLGVDLDSLCGGRGMISTTAQAMGSAPIK